MNLINKSLYGNISVFLNEHKAFVFYNFGFFVLFLFSIFFYEERIHGSDASIFLFNAIDSGFFYSERGRYIICLSQWFPLIFVWLQMPMKVALLAYSVGNALFFYILFNCVYWKYQQKISGMAFLLVQTLGMGEAYFAWSYGEVYFGVALVVLLYFILIKPWYISLFEYFLIAAILFLLVTGHPLVYFVLFFALSALFFLGHKSTRVLVVSIIFVLLLIGKIFLLPSYDGQLASQVLQDINQINFDFFEITQLLSIYWLNFLCLFFLLTLLFFYKQYSIVLLAFFSCVLISLTIMSFAPLYGATQQYYLSYSGITIVSFLLLHRISKSQILKITLYFFFSIVTIMSLVGIYDTSKYFTMHKLKIKELLSYVYSMSNKSDFVIKAANLYKDESLTWVSSELYFEALLLSAQDKNPVKIHVFERLMERIEWTEKNIQPNEGPDAPRKEKKKYAYSMQNKKNVENYLRSHYTVHKNKNYFHVNQMQRVKFLNTDSMNRYVDIKNNLSIDKVEYLKPNFLKITMKNQGKVPIYSASSSNIAYRVVLKDEKEVTVPILADVDTQLTEYFEVSALRKNNLRRLDLIHQGIVIDSIKFNLLDQGF